MKQSVLIQFDEEKYLQQVEDYKSFIPDFEAIVELYNGMSLPRLNNDDFIKLFTGLEDLIFDKMTGGNPLSIAGIEIHKHEAFKLIKHPVGYDEMKGRIVQLIEELRNCQDHSIQSIPLATIKTFFELDKNGAVQLKQSKCDELKSRCEVWATSETAKKMVELANCIIEKCKDADISKVIRVEPNGIGRVIDTILLTDRNSTKVGLNVKGLQEYNSR